MTTEDHNNKPSLDSAPQATHTSRGNGLAWAVSALSVTSTSVALFGYGVSLGAESAIGLPHSATFASPLDLLDLSAGGILEIFNGASKLQLGHLITKVYADKWLSLVIMFAIGCTLTLLLWLGARRDAWLARMRQQMNDWSAARRAQQVPVRAWQISGICSLGLLAMPLLGAFVVWLLLLISSLFAGLPIFGHAAGSAYINEWVIEPVRCAPIADREQRLRTGRASGEKTALCVEAENMDGTRRFQGRVVTSTPSAIVLFNPLTGVSERIPLATARVRQIGEIAPQTLRTPDAPR